MIYSFSRFIYGFEVDESNQYLDFKEGGGSATYATLDVGSYSAQQFCTALRTALNSAGTLSYTVTFNRATRKLTVTSSGGTFQFLTGNGGHIGADPFGLMGFTKTANTALASSLTGQTTAGDVYEPQYYLQSYVPTRNLSGAANASVNKTASGQSVEVIKFGDQSFMECEIKWATDITQAFAGNFKSNPTGVEDLRRFMEFLVTKAPVEFLEDESDATTFETLMLESTTESDDGTSFRLKELYDEGLRDYYSSDKLKFRKIEDS